MDLTHTFTVPASVEDTWAAFVDIESVAGCFPGARVTSVEGDEFKGTCKVKLGPISLTYTGAGHFVERDDSAHRFVIEAKGKDKRGNGTAGATVTAVLNAGAPGTTDVEVNTDLAITGKPAQFGRGVIQDVSDKLLQQFVDCLRSKVGAAPETEVPAEAAPVGKHAADADPTTSGAGARKAAASTYAGVSAGAEVNGEATEPDAGGERKSDEGAKRPPVSGAAAAQSTTDALDLGATVLPILLRSYWKPIVGVLLVLLVLRKLFRRRRG